MPAFQPAQITGAWSTIGEWMLLRSHIAIACLGMAFVSTGLPLCSDAHQAASSSLVEPAVSLPEAPHPQFETLADNSIAAQSEPAQAGTSPASSSSQTPASESSTVKTQRDKAHEQIKEQEHQRVLGILPAFNTSYRSDAVSLAAKEKISIAFRSAVDPVAFASAFVVGGLHELDHDTGFGWGPAGYGKRVGAAYLDAFDGTMIGNGFLPAILHQDPRYFRLGHGSTARRLLYAAAASAICKHDISRKWEPNYSNLLGNIAAGAISNLYYPSNEEGVGQTINNGLIVSAEGAIGSVFQEFWPDISRKFLYKDPTRGLDAEAHAADNAAKRAKDNQN